MSLCVFSRGGGVGEEVTVLHRGRPGNNIERREEGGGQQKERPLSVQPPAIRTQSHKTPRLQYICPGEAEDIRNVTVKYCQIIGIHDSQ